MKYSGLPVRRVASAAGFLSERSDAGGEEPPTLDPAHCQRNPPTTE